MMKLVRLEINQDMVCMGILRKCSFCLFLHASSCKPVHAVKTIYFWHKEATIQWHYLVESLNCTIEILLQ
jgi:hypothetical protein